MSTFDFFSPLSQIGDTIVSGWERGRKVKAQADVAEGIKDPNADYRALAGTALEGGDTGLATTLLSLGQTQGQQRADATAGAEIARMFPAGKAPQTLGSLGGGAPASSGRPSTSSGAPVDLDGLGGKYGVSPSYLGTTRQLESGGRDDAVSPTGAKGAYQFTGPTAKAYGLTDPNEPTASADAAARLAADNRNTLRSRLGRDPADSELYLAHQQGGGGAGALLSANPNANVVDALAPAYGGDRTRAAQAVNVNGGRPDMTAGQFVTAWRGKYGAAAASLGGQPDTSPVRTATTPAEIAAAEASTGTDYGTLFPGRGETASVPSSAGLGRSSPRAPGATASAPSLVDDADGDGAAAPAPAKPAGNPKTWQNATDVSKSAVNYLAKQNVGDLIRIAATPNLGPGMKALTSTLLTHALAEAKVPDDYKAYQIAKVAGETEAKNYDDWRTKGKDDAGETIEKQVKARTAVATTLGLDPGSPDYRSYITSGKLPAGKDVATVAQNAARASEAQKYGLDPNSPEGQHYVLTGQLADPAKTGEMKATEQKMYAGNVEKTNILTQQIKDLEKARTLNPKVYSGTYAPDIARGIARNAPFGLGNAIVDPDRVAATTQYENLVNGATLSQGKELFGSRPTNYDERLLQALKANPNMTPQERDTIIGQMIEHRKTLLQETADNTAAMKSGTFFKRSATASATGIPSIPRDGSQPAGQPRAQSPQQPEPGGAAAGALASARAAISKGADPQAVAARLRQNGIDPGGL